MAGPGKTAGVCVVKVPEESSLGPAMLACTEAQRAFVVALITMSPTDKTQAAFLSGNGGTVAARRVTGSRLAAHPKVIAAIKEEAEKRMSAGAALAANVILEIAMDPMHKDRLRAAEMLKNQAGLIVAQRIQHDVEIHDSRTTEEIHRQNVMLMERLGVQLPKIAAPVIDAEFQPVETGSSSTEDAEFEEVVESEGTLEGLEDIL